VVVAVRKDGSPFAMIVLLVQGFQSVAMLVVEITELLALMLCY